MPSFDILRHISEKIAPFINAMMQSGEYDEFAPGMVLDVYQLLPEDFMRHIDPDACEIHYFLTADVTAQERFRILKAHDTEKDYTFYKPDGELREGCVWNVEQSRFMREQCVQFGLPYYETSKDRKQVFERFLQSLS